MIVTTEDDLRERQRGMVTGNVETPPGGEGYYEWTFHQFCLNPTTQRVWDAAFRFWDSGYILPDNMPRDQEYRDRLVRYYLFVYPEPDYSYTLYEFDPAYYWVPTPDAGFIPSVTANDIPPTP